MNIYYVISLAIGFSAISISIISALKIYDRSQYSNARDIFVYPVFPAQDKTSKDIPKACVRNCSDIYPIFDIEIYYLGCSLDPVQPPLLWGTAQQILPREKLEMNWSCPHNGTPPLTDIHVKGIADSLAGKYINYHIVCLYNTSSKRRWLKTYDGEFYRYNSLLGKHKKWAKLIKSYRMRVNNVKAAQ
jgi:hypothetical protein